MNRRSPALATAVFDASRGWPSHSVFPVLASSPKNCPLDFSDKPNRVSPMSAGLHINSETSLFSHTTSTAHLPSRRVGLSAVTGFLWLATMIVSPYTIGVIALSVPPGFHGCSQSGAPSATATLMTLLFVIDTIWRTPPNSTMIGDA